MEEDPVIRVVTEEEREAMGGKEDGVILAQTNQPMDFFSNLENENTCRFYKHYNYEGDILILGKGATIDLTKKYTGFNDEISSFRVGKNCVAIMCKHPLCDGSDHAII